MHACTIDGLHGQRGITVEAMVLLDGRLMMVRIVSRTLVPARIVIFEMILVMLLVVHLKLAHLGR